MDLPQECDDKLIENSVTTGNSPHIDGVKEENPGAFSMNAQKAFNQIQIVLKDKYSK